MGIDPGDGPNRGRRDAGDRSAGPGPGERLPRAGELAFSKRELLDFAAAWLVLSVAFGVLFFGASSLLNPGVFVQVVPLLMLTVGVGFVLHELAHKVVAVRFGQLAQFKADYGMLFLALMSAFAGFLFAAPGAVYHRGYLTEREGGLIALAGPVTNIVLAVGFFGLSLVGSEGGLVALVGSLGLGINLFLAAFNMLPIRSLDGRTVFEWNKAVFAAVFVPSAAVVVYRFVAGPGLI